MIIGVDASTYQGKMNWAQTRAAGAKYAMLRAASIGSADGVPYVDYQFERNVAEAPQHLLLVAIYQYLRPNFDAHLQADFMLEQAAKVQCPVLVAPDLEATGGKSKSYIASWFQRYCLRLQAGLEDDRLLCYTRGSYWNPYVGDPAWMQGLTDVLYYLWVARYSDILAHPWGDGNYRPLPWQDYTLWQYSADGNFQGAKYGADSYHIDLDRYQGTFEQLQQFVDPQASPPPPPNGELEQRLTLLEGKHAELERWAREEIAYG